MSRTDFTFEELLNCGKGGADDAWYGKRSCKNANGNETNPYFLIDKAEGIYKVYILDKDISAIKFASPVYRNNKSTKISGIRDLNDLENVYKSNLKCEPHEEKHVIYIGKAKNLRRRIKQYMRTVYGGENHKGGIDIWAIENYEELLNIEISYLSGNSKYTDSRSRGWEKDEIEKFKKNHNGNRPMANRED